MTFQNWPCITWVRYITRYLLQVAGAGVWNPFVYVRRIKMYLPVNITNKWHDRTTSRTGRLLCVYVPSNSKY